MKEEEEGGVHEEFKRACGKGMASISFLRSHTSGNWCTCFGASKWTHNNMQILLKFQVNQMKLMIFVTMTFDLLA